MLDGQLEVCWPRLPRLAFAGYPAARGCLAVRHETGLMVQDCTVPQGNRYFLVNLQNLLYGLK